MVYAYARVSTRDQNLARQIQAFKQAGVDERFIISDKASGATFDRQGYNLLTGTDSSAPLLRTGDTLIIMSLDRLGRNYDEIKVQWARLTAELGVCVRVLDIPILANANNTLESRFLTDLTLQILAYVAEKERESIKARQRQGIDSMTRDNQGHRVSGRTGRTYGRPTIPIPEQFGYFYNMWKNGKITATQAMTQLRLTRTTFYKFAKEYEKTITQI